MDETHQTNRPVDLRSACRPTKVVPGSRDAPGARKGTTMRTTNEVLADEAAAAAERRAARVSNGLDEIRLRVLISDVLTGRRVVDYKVRAGKVDTVRAVETFATIRALCERGLVQADYDTLCEYGISVVNEVRESDKQRKRGACYTDEMAIGEAFSVLYGPPAPADPSTIVPAIPMPKSRNGDVKIVRKARKAWTISREEWAEMVKAGREEYKRKNILPSR